MNSVFVSSQAIHQNPASGLINLLRNSGFRVLHSPNNPSVTIDPAFPDWYSVGLPHALSAVECFVAALDPGWDSSTWMAIEAEDALQLYTNGSLKAYYYFNPYRIVVHKGAMERYLIAELPTEPRALVAVLKL
jgi:hypothetical protein